MTSIRLTRLGALRGLAVGAVAALTGLSLTGDETDAKKKIRKRKVCICTGETVGSCSTKKVKRRKLKKLFKKNPCSYGSKCNGTNPCTPPLTNASPPPPPPPPPPPAAGFDINVDLPGISIACPLGTECAGTALCVAGICLDICLLDGDCPDGFGCVPPGGGLPGLVCLPDDVANAVSCVTGADCDTGRCADTLLCALCPVAAICGELGQEQCCVAEAECLGNTCVLGVG